MLPSAPVQPLAVSESRDAAGDDGPDVAGKLLDFLESRACISFGIALIAAAVIVPLATPYAVLLSTIGVIPLILASQHGITRSIVVTSLFPLLLVTGALDRRHSLDVELHAPPSADGAPRVLIVRTDEVYLVTASLGFPAQTVRISTVPLGPVELRWFDGGVDAVEPGERCQPRVYGTLSWF